MAELNCISGAIKILRTDLIGSYAEDYSYSQVFFLSYRYARIGGCIDARFNVVREQNAIGTLAKGDRITITYYGTVVWFGTVNTFTSDAQNLEINCIGTWAALKAVFPSNMVFGLEADFAEGDGENEFNDVANPQAILVYLYNAYLASVSDITAVNLGNAVTNKDIQKLELTGKRDLAMIAEYLATIAGNFGVGIDEEWDFFLTNPYDYDVVNFKACEAAAYQITKMVRTDSIAWLSFPTSLVIQGAGDYQETFKADIFGYELATIAGITLDNQKVISVPHVQITEEKTYDSMHAGQVDVESIDAARYADMFFQNRAIDAPMQWLIECQNVNTQFYPWETGINLFDVHDQFMGAFTIEMIEYQSEDANISIKEMDIKKLRPVGDA